MISKNISVASLEIDPVGGKIWMNAPNCILRIDGLKFKNIEDKFSMIDIQENSACMISGKLENEDFSIFLEKISNIIIPKLLSMNSEDRSKYIDNIFLKIEEEIKNDDNL